MDERRGYTGGAGARDRQGMAALPGYMPTEDTTPTTSHERAEMQGGTAGRDEGGQEPELRNTNALGLDVEAAHIHGEPAQPAAGIRWPWDETQELVMQFNNEDADSDSRPALPILPPFVDRSSWERSPAQESDLLLGGGRRPWGVPRYNTDTQFSSLSPSERVEHRLEDTATVTRLNDAGRSNTSHDTTRGQGSNTRPAPPTPPPFADRSEEFLAQENDPSLPFVGGQRPWGYGFYNPDTHPSPPSSSERVGVPLEDAETRLNDAGHSSSIRDTSTQNHRGHTTGQYDSSKQFVIIGTTRSGYPSLHSPFSDPQGNIDRPAQLWGPRQRSPTETTLPLYHGMSSASQSAAAQASAKIPTDHSARGLQGYDPRNPARRQWSNLSAPRQRANADRGQGRPSEEPQSTALVYRAPVRRKVQRLGRVSERPEDGGINQNEVSPPILLAECV
ncbi:hypothetical protein C8Q70DRAFT_143277 [Cubamyces menziesii]|nr:hypothetical protein C8Q70DRAFT_143277 [Cubamyces menziesii]